ncbi:hypothetical protein ACVWZR_005088 [Bradyrhizobium sp. i1.3.1]
MPDIDLVERGRQPRGGGVALALGGECAEQPLAHQAGDCGGAGSRHGEEAEPDQIRRRIARQGSMGQKEQRRADHGDGSAGHGGSETR